jgi:membrane associated rhomboid family serine protease
MIILMFLVSRLEYSFGAAIVLVIYLATGVSGDIFSNLLYGQSNVASVGSSTSLYGMVGWIIGYMIINWGSLAPVCFLFKFKMIIIVVLSLAYLLLFTDVA